MTDYPTIEDYKAFKKITSTTDDISYQILLDSAISMIENEVKFKFPVTEYVEFPITKGKSIILNKGNVTEISELALDITRAFTSPEIITSFYHSNSVIYPDYLVEGYGVYRVTYLAGYPVIPADIIQAIYELINYHGNRFNVGIGKNSFNSEGFGGAVQTSFSNYAMPLSVIKILENYK